MTKMDEAQVISNKLGTSQKETDTELIIDDASAKIKPSTIPTEADQEKVLESPSGSYAHNLVLMSSPTEGDLSTSVDRVSFNRFDYAKLNENLEKALVEKDTEMYSSLEKITSLSIPQEMVRERYLELSPNSYKINMNLEAIIETENSVVKTDRKSPLCSPVQNQASKDNIKYTRQSSCSPFGKNRMTNFLFPRSNTNRQNTMNSSFEDTSIGQDSKFREFSFKMTYFRPIDDSKLDEFINNTNITRDQLSPMSPGSPVNSSPHKRLSSEPRSKKSRENALTSSQDASDTNGREPIYSKDKEGSPKDKRLFTQKGFY